MWVYRVGKFEVSSLRSLMRVAIGGGIVIGAGVAMAPALGRAPRATRVWARAASRVLGLNETVRGLENVDPNTEYVVAPLHEGFPDALLLAHLPVALRFVARDELFEWPLLGRALRYSGQIEVVPETRLGGYRDLVSEIRSAAEQRFSVVVFPQGSILGIEAAFQSGAFRIADRLELPVLPVVITGTHRVWEHPFTDRLRFGQAVEMTVLEPLPVSQAVARRRDLESEMKRIALHDHIAPARRFDPDIDGYWDGYRYDIDPAFADVAAKVAMHRQSRKDRPG